MRKHATGKAKIELHVLNVERGLSWEGAQEKWEMLTGSEEGFYLSQQVSTTQFSKIRKKVQFREAKLFFEISFFAKNEEFALNFREKRKKKSYPPKKLRQNCIFLNQFCRKFQFLAGKNFKSLV